MLRAAKKALFLIVLARITAFAQTAEIQSAELALQVSSELEIRLTEPPHWEKGYSKSFDRIAPMRLYGSLIWASTSICQLQIRPSGQNG